MRLYECLKSLCYFSSLALPQASLATSVTTALSFFANLASVASPVAKLGGQVSQEGCISTPQVLKPLREFGFFMGWRLMLVQDVGNHEIASGSGFMMFYFFKAVLKVSTRTPVSHNVGASAMSVCGSLRVLRGC